MQSEIQIHVEKDTHTHTLISPYKQHVQYVQHDENDSTYNEMQNGQYGQSEKNEQYGQSGNVHDCTDRVCRTYQGEVTEIEEEKEVV